MFQRKRLLILAFLTGWLAMIPVQWALAEELPAAVNQLLPTLQKWGTNPILVAAVRQQNALNRPLAEIKNMDSAWMATSTITPLMNELMNNAPAQELKKLEQSAPYFFELFLMDNQGANVAMTNKTSDYWQGDEAKFTESFKGGAGAVHIGLVKFDESAQAYLVQISVPILDGQTAIGALTVGIDLDRLAVTAVPQ